MKRFEMAADAEKATVLILGAGPAGLTVASGLGRNAVVLERSGNVGGLGQSIEFCGATFDLGGHSFHTPHADVQAFVNRVMDGRMVSQRRDARVWVDGQAIPYPFQQHYRELRNRSIVDACDAHQSDAILIAESDNFEEWIVRRFGAGIARHFMLPYNRKLWARDLRSMSCEWVNERVATDAQKSEETGERRRPLAGDSVVSYPAEGGFGRIFEALAACCPAIQLNEEVVEVDLPTRTARTRSGRRWAWGRLVNTLPLPVFLGLLRGCDRDILQLASGLEAVSLKIVLLAVGDSSVETPQRVYNPEPHGHAHKIAFNHTSSPHLRSQPRRGVMCEISYSETKPVPPDAALITDSWDWLRERGFVSPGATLEGAKVVDLRFGYPVPTSGRAQIVNAIREYLHDRGIHSIGRFGSWSYMNSDGCIRQGIDTLKTSFAEWSQGGDLMSGGHLASGDGQDCDAA